MERFMSARQERKGAWTLGAMLGGLLFYVAIAAIFLTVELI
jgi:hypothetical protein